MGGNYVEVPVDLLFARLESAGFKRVSTSGEAVFDREHDKDRRYVVRVYTSVGVDRIRGCGRDAIRVVALFRRDAYVSVNAAAVGIYKGKRVHRSGTVEAVLERMIERARDAYAFCNCRIQESKNEERS
jgi:hypothetical protein